MIAQMKNKKHKIKHGPAKLVTSDLKSSKPFSNKNILYLYNFATFSSIFINIVTFVLIIKTNSLSLALVLLNKITIFTSFIWSSVVTFF